MLSLRLPFGHTKNIGTIGGSWGHIMRYGECVQGVRQETFQENLMAIRDLNKKRGAEARHTVNAQEDKEYHNQENLDAKTHAPASAKNIARPPTSLDAPPKRNITDYNVCLLGDPDLAPLLADVEKVNNNPRSEIRTPLMTVIQAILGAEGGSMPVSKLAAKVKKRWNRPFPASPYTDEELVFIVARNSDSIRVTETG